MNVKTIEKILTSTGEIIPAFKYENPLLDIDVANRLSVTFIKLLDSKVNQQNNNLRLLILEEIRKTCKIVPDGHLCIDDYITEILQNSYEELLKDQNNYDTGTGKILDNFLIRNIKELNISSIYPSLLSSLSPEVIKAITNLKCKKRVRKILLKDAINWNISDGENGIYTEILKSMWNKETISEIELQHDDVSLRNKSEIEKVLLKQCQCIFETEIVELEDWLLDQDDLQRLLKICAVSSECFQICCCILNTIFIRTDFRREMEQFVHLFIVFVKAEFVTSKLLYFSLLYPNKLRHIVALLDVDISSISSEIQNSYTTYVREHLTKLHNDCEYDLIMLLSHFGQWFDLYYKNDKCSIDCNIKIKVEQ